jgi:hypothetical protein
MPQYTVRAGDHLTRIARRYGFTDPAVVWSASQNDALRQAGRTPDQLAPGDNLFIPDRVDRVVSGGTNARHKVQVNLAPLRLRVVLQSLGARPVANARGTLQIENDETAITTSGSGEFVVEIDDTTEVATLALTGNGTTLHGVTIPLLIGHLDPASTFPGQQARLNNLGYRAGLGTDPAAHEYRSAVEEFQCDEGLAVDGKCGPATIAKLQSVHGC